ncbi:MAG: succinate-semialdehyde dehydrogenase (NADP(+)) [Woeseiaceae bacterium]|nr:succinate-semialdehyde dehydrogenase (NADP(+)) [Woeseiaceae bacterium]|tara:strand:- start:9195 stop:10670 length:1476 start_codon:yes stop_codon:yes gene_type:complete
MFKQSFSLANPDFLCEQAYVDGEWISADKGRTVDVFNPATGELIGTVPDCGRDTTCQAIEAAEKAFVKWRKLTAGQRASFIEKWYDLIIENLQDLGRILTIEQGKPIAEAEGEIKYAASIVKWFAEEGRRINGYDVASPEANRRIMVMKEPVGVCAAITPWNFPAAMITRKCAPALAAGCTVVVKPSELTPYTALALAKLAEKASIPAGVFNVVTGLPVEIGAEITSNPIVRKLSFTGSTKIGSLLMEQSAKTVKRLSLELGGNAPLIVFDDADLDLAIEGAIASKFRNAGQTCICANRILVQSGIYDEFANKLEKVISEFKIGNGQSEGVTIGPLINATAVKKVQAHIDDALALGGKLMSVMTPVEMDKDKFIAPAVLRNATEDMLCAQEETFGPLAPLFRFKDEDEALRIANDTPYGLASYFYTEDMHRAWRVADKLEAGMVALNTGSLAMEMAPFGGVKSSGLGREGGAAGIEEYLELKAFHVAGLKL